MQNTSRRRFIKQTVVGTTGIAVLPLFQSCKVASSDTIRFGIIGLGQQAMNLMMGFSRISGIQVVAGADVYGIKRERFQKRMDDYYQEVGESVEVKTYKNYKELLDRSDIDAVVIATIFQEDLSAIASLSSNGITSPADLDGKMYASYQARYEDEIVRQMIKNDGGKGDFKIVNPEKLGIWNTIIKGKSDATWIFRNWEGIQAENEGIDLNLFKMADYGIPYGYSPIIMTSKKGVAKRARGYAHFLEATKKGYLYAQDNPSEAVECFASHVAEQDLNIDLVQSQIFSSPFYGNMDNWGVLEKQKVNQYLDWLLENKLEEQPFNFEDVVLSGLV